MYALADCNNFFVSCERVFRPDLNGKPVIVLSNNDGCAVARSNEAKALGVKMGAPLFKIRDIVEKNNIAVFSGNMALYGDMSIRVQMTLTEFVPLVEKYSIDEAFLDLRGLKIENYDIFAKTISRTCKKNTGIPVSVGIAPTKTLAKIASKLCKQYPKLDGGCYMHRPQDIEKVLRKFPIEDVWGIGRRFSDKLKKMGIHTAWDFTQTDRGVIQNIFGITAVRTWKELRGEACIEFDDYFAPHQSICVSRSFAKDIKDIDLLTSQIANFASLASEKLRKQDSLCQSMIVFARTNRFKDDEPQFYGTVEVNFWEGTDNHLKIVSSASEACKKLFSRGIYYKKAGVIFTRIIQRNEVVKSLFENPETEKHNKALTSTIDALNQSYGRGIVKVGIQGDGSIVSSSERQSPHYTTRWSDIPKVSVK